MKLKKIKMLFGKPVAIIYFFLSVMPHGQWDFKNIKSWNLSPNYDYYWHGNKMRFDDIGNMHYGYVGKVLFNTVDLKVAAGVEQLGWDIIIKHKIQWGINTNFDDPRDQKMIEAGCILWDYGF